MARVLRTAAHRLIMLLSGIQLAFIFAGAAIVLTFPAGPAGFAGTVPWYGMPVKIAGAVAFGGVSFYLFRAAVRALRIEEPDTRKDKGLLALLNLIAGVCLTLLPFYISFWHHLFSYEFPGSYYWWAIEGGGKAVALSAIPCWFWWGTVIAAQACARRQKYLAGVAMAALPLWLPLYVLAAEWRAGHWHG